MCLIEQINGQMKKLQVQRADLSNLNVWEKVLLWPRHQLMNLT